MSFKHTSSGAGYSAPHQRNNPLHDPNVPLQIVPTSSPPTQQPPHPLPSISRPKTRPHHHHHHGGGASSGHTTMVVEEDEEEHDFFKDVYSIDDHAHTGGGELRSRHSSFSLTSSPREAKPIVIPPPVLRPQHVYAPVAPLGMLSLGVLSKHKKESKGGLLGEDDTPSGMKKMIQGEYGELCGLFVCF